MKEVSLEFVIAIFQAYVRLCQKKARTPRDLLEVLGVSTSNWRKVKYISWSSYVEFQEKLDAAFAAEGFSYYDLNVEIQRAEAIRSFSSLLRLVASPAMLYKGIWTWMGPAHFPLLRQALIFLPSNRIEISLHLPKAFRGCSTYFENVVQSQIVLPRLIGLPDSKVIASELSSHHMVATLEIPRSGTIFALIKRGINRLLHRQAEVPNFKEFQEDLIHTKNESHQRQRDFEELFNKSPVGIVVIKEGKIVQANTAFCRSLNCSEKDVLQQRWDELVASSEEASAEEDTYDVNLRVKPGGLKPFKMIKGSKITYMGTPCDFYLTRDVSATKDLEQKLERQQALAVLGELSASIAHQVNTPLTIIMSHLQFLLSSLADKHLPQSQDLVKIIEMVRKLGMTVDCLVNLSRNQSKLSEPASVPAILIRAHELSEPKAKGMGVKVNPPEGAGETNRYVFPELELTQILINLINNAIDAAAAVEKKEVDIRADLEGEYVCFSVINYGETIPAAIQERIMEPFFTTKANGTGLGLSVCQKLTKLLGGEIRLAPSNTDVCFQVRLPAAQVLNAGAGSKT